MIIKLAWFLLGALAGTVALIVIACCYVSSESDKEAWKYEHDRDTIEPGNKEE